MSLLFTSNLKFPEGDLRKNQESMDSNLLYHTQNHQLHNSSLTRHCSTPSSFLENLVNGDSGGGGGNCEDYRYFRPSSPEIDTFIAKYTTPSNGSGDYGSHGLQEFGVKALKQEEPEPVAEQNEYSNGSSRMMYQNLSLHSLINDNSVDVGNAVDHSYSVASSMALENSMQERMGTGNGSNLIRQNSLPAGFFSDLGIDNGFSGIRDGGCFRACNDTDGEASTLASRLINRLNYSPRSSSRFLPQIAEEKSFASYNDTRRQYIPDFPSNSWNNTSFSGVKRDRDDECNMSFGLNGYETQNGNSGNQSTRLIHHLSLPKTSAEMAAVEKYLHFQGSVPCKIRAKRGCATHPRSIAERVRRTRISERMRKLQDLFPNMDKQTNTADMLDLAVDYIKNLQKQVETLKDTKAKCTCSNKQKQY